MPNQVPFLIEDARCPGTTSSAPNGAACGRPAESFEGLTSELSDHTVPHIYTNKYNSNKNNNNDNNDNNDNNNNNNNTDNNNDNNNDNIDNNDNNDNTNNNNNNNNKNNNNTNNSNNMYIYTCSYGPGVKELPLIVIYLLSVLA